MQAGYMEIFMNTEILDVRSMTSPEQGILMWACIENFWRARATITIENPHGGFLEYSLLRFIATITAGIYVNDGYVDQPTVH